MPKKKSKKKPKENPKKNTTYKKIPQGLRQKCPPALSTTLQCLIDEGEIYCGEGKTWIEKPGSDGTLGKCVLKDKAKKIKQDKERHERARRRSAAKNMTKNEKNSKLKF